MDTISPSNMGEYCIHVRLSKHTVKYTPHMMNLDIVYYLVYMEAGRKRGGRPEYPAVSSSIYDVMFGSYPF